MGAIDKRYVSRRLRAAKRGKAEALYDLGLLYATGQGVPQDFVAAHMWFNLAAMKGIARARVDRAEVARDMSEMEIAEAQRQARAWLHSYFDGAPDDPRPANGTRHGNTAHQANGARR